MNLYSYLKEEHHYTDYQIKLVHYVLMSLLSEFSKFILMGLFFYYTSKLSYYLFSVSLLLILRRYSGGLHCKSYPACLITSFCYLYICIMILPQYAPVRFIQLILLAAAIVISYYISPIPSPYHKELQHGQIKSYKMILVILIFLYFVSVFILPPNRYLAIGFWVIMIHILQLIAAYLRNRLRWEV